MVEIAPAASRRSVAVGVDEAFERFVAEQQGALQNFAFLVIGNREDARDAVQDALLGLYRGWDRVRNDPGAYARRSIVNAHVSAWRKRRKETPFAEMDGPSAAPPGPDTLWVQAMCRALPRKQRAAVVLSYIEDRTYDEIGALLGCSAATARSLVSRGVATLRRTNSTDLDAR